MKYIWLRCLKVVLGGVPMFAQAATYNFYFNNIEQGANGNAAPTVTIGAKGDKVPPNSLSSSDPTVKAESVSLPQSEEVKDFTVPTPVPAIVPGTEVKAPEVAPAPEAIPAGPVQGVAFPQEARAV